LNQVSIFLVQAKIPYYMPGDIVRVLDDIAKVHELQKTGPGWLDDMVLVCVPEIMPLAEGICNKFVCDFTSILKHCCTCCSAL